MGGEGRPGNTYHMMWMPVNVGWMWGEGAYNYMFVHNKSESEFLIIKVRYSWSHEHLESCLAMEHSKMITSTLFEMWTPPPYVHLGSS